MWNVLEKHQTWKWKQLHFVKKYRQKISNIFGAHSWVFDQFSKLHIWPLCASPEAESNFSFSSRVQYPVGSPHLRRFLSWVSHLSNIFPSQFLTFGCKAVFHELLQVFVLVFQTQPWTHSSALSNLSIFPSFKVNVFFIGNLQLCWSSLFNAFSYPNFPPRSSSYCRSYPQTIHTLLFPHTAGA